MLLLIAARCEATAQDTALQGPAPLAAYSRQTATTAATLALTRVGLGHDGVRRDL